MRRHLLTAALFVPVVFGCKNFQLKDYTETPVEPPKTVITKEVLSQRLSARLVKEAEKVKFENPNPLTLQLRFADRGNQYILNQERLENFRALAGMLGQIFKMREENGVFIEGSNEVYKKITLPAYQKLIDQYNSKNITVEDFEKLVDDLRNEGFGQIEFDMNEENQPMIPERPDIDELKPSARPSSDLEPVSPKTNPPKTISGGVLNGKAIDLPKPPYPPAARAVRASGAVNVQVTVDEDGNVVSAVAVSGHPLLRPSAVTAARNAKFKPTILSGKAVKVTGVIVYNFAPE